MSTDIQVAPERRRRKAVQMR